MLGSCCASGTVIALYIVISFDLHSTLWNYQSLRLYLRSLKPRNVNSPGTLVSGNLKPRLYHKEGNYNTLPFLF